VVCLRKNRGRGLRDNLELVGGPPSSIPAYWGGKESNDQKLPTKRAADGQFVRLRSLT